MGTELAANGHEVEVVVGVFGSGLQRVVVHVAHRKGHDALHPHGLQLEVDQGPRSVLGQDLVDPQGDLRARTRFSLHEVGLQDLL